MIPSGILHDHCASVVGHGVVFDPEDFKEELQTVLDSGCSVTPEKLKISEKLEEKKQIPVLRDKDSEVHPIIEQKCPECGHGKAYFWTMQTRSSDEAETKFFKCTKCSNTWREYR